MDALKLNPITIELLIQSSTQLAEIIPSLKILILFGSRARGDIHTNSDWDFAFLCDSKQQSKSVLFDSEIYAILADLFRINDDQIDAINLASCPPLLAHAIAQDGKLLYERDSDLFKVFKQQSLMSEEQLKAIQKDLRAKLERFLRQRGV